MMRESSGDAMQHENKYACESDCFGSRCLLSYVNRHDGVHTHSRVPVWLFQLDGVAADLIQAVAAADSISEG